MKKQPKKSTRQMATNELLEFAIQCVASGLLVINDKVCLRDFIIPEIERVATEIAQSVYDRGDSFSKSRFMPIENMAHMIVCDLFNPILIGMLSSVTITGESVIFTSEVVKKIDDFSQNNVSMDAMALYQSYIAIGDLETANVVAIENDLCIEAISKSLNKKLTNNFALSN
jgi:hypothetical protein